KASHGAFARRDRLYFPALVGCIALLHPEQIAGEERGLIAAGAGADFQDHVAFVHRILRDECELDLPLECRPFLLELRPFCGGHRAHFGIGGRVSDESVEAVDLRNNAAIALHRLDDGSEFGKFAREFNVGIRRHWACKLTFDRPVPSKECVQFLLRKHGSRNHKKAGSRAPPALVGSPAVRWIVWEHQICSPCSAAKAWSRSRIGTPPVRLSINGSINAATPRTLTSRSMAFTGPTAEGESESARYPMATRASAPIGFEASSPHSVTGFA